MTDYSELKRIANAADDTYTELCLYGGDERAEAWNQAEAAFYDAANPTAVLALIAENEELRQEFDRYGWLQKTTPYRFKKIQDASVTDGGDCLYFHNGRFNDLVDAEMSAESKS
ncbi:hypothetical protein [Pseudomonas koreensis]|uniref:hypothetical protein n=1 Tax=Pseudomonas koreensis TaxID=198620 RepID=UPI0018E68EF4|nr:hypothetical protein [Pseudomonas koreensis]MBI6948576.1 hypothetical protein [Pseudomonas koreensis]